MFEGLLGRLRPFKRNPDGVLFIVSTPNGDNPFFEQEEKEQEYIFGAKRPKGVFSFTTEATFTHCEKPTEFSEDDIKEWMDILADRMRSFADEQMAEFWRPQPTVHTDDRFAPIQFESWMNKDRFQPKPGTIIEDGVFEEVTDDKSNSIDRRNT